MKLQALLKPSKVCEHLFIAGVSEAYDALRALGNDKKNNCAVRFLRGPKCGDRAGFFDEAAAALQFPCHFGENWDAFDDCLTELPNIEEPILVLAILDAGGFLLSPKDALSQFQAVISQVTKTWASPGKGKSARALHVVYQAENAEALGTRFTGAVKLN